MGCLMARRLADSGTKVAIVDVNQKLLDEVSQSHENITAFNCDVCNFDAVNSIAQQVENTLGPIDRISPAAAIMPAQTIEAMDQDSISRVMRINDDGVINVVKAVMPLMIERNSGQIVLFGSLAGTVPGKGFAAYGATKAAINLFGEVLSEELKNTGVQVLTVRPAAVSTPLINQATGDGGLPGLRKQVKSGKMATPEAIINELEKALKRNKTVCHPTAEAKVGAILRRVSPSFTWWIGNKLNA